jgi:hypothetical protein
MLSDSFASGAVFGGDNIPTGGLVGYNFGGVISNCYAAGAVTGGQNSQVGGLIGINADNTDYHVSPLLGDSYSSGNTSGGSGASVGGLIGGDAADARNSDLYWDRDTSGVSDPSHGAGNIPNDPGITGLSDTQLKSGLPAGFDPSIWNEKRKHNHGHPYLIDNPPPK